MNAILLYNGTVIKYDSAVDMIRGVIVQGGNVLAFYIAGCKSPAQAQPATKEQQELILAFGFQCLNERIA